MRILNLYAGIGGNRKLWGNEHEITAVEYNPDIAKIYQGFFPEDKVVVGDAHEYLLKHFHEFDFIWASPPCPSHSRINIANSFNPYKDNSRQISNGGGFEIRYPEMSLYQEIIILKTWFKGLWVIENVIPYYDLLIPSSVELDRHLFWANFNITKTETKKACSISSQTGKGHRFGITIENSKVKDKRKLLRNMVNPEIGLHILNCAMGIKETKSNQLELEL